MAWRSKLIHKATKSFASKGGTPLQYSDEDVTFTRPHARTVSSDSIPTTIDISMHKDSLQKNKEELEDILEDSPMTREQFRQREVQLENVSTTIRKLLKLSKSLALAGETFQNLVIQFGQELQKFDFSDLPSDLQSKFAASAHCLGETVVNIGDYQSIFMNAIKEVFSEPLDRFLREDMKTSKESFKQHARIRTKYDQAISKFSHIKKTETEKIPEAEHELYYIRKEFQNSALDYASKLRRIQTLSKIQVLEAACAFVVSEKAFFCRGVIFFFFHFN